MKKIVSFLKPYKKLLIIGPTFKLFEAILELMLPFFMSKVIDIGIVNQDKAYVIKMGLVMLTTALVGVTCALICQYSASIVSQGTGTSIRNAMFQHIGSFSNAELDQFGTSSLINRITNDVNQVQTAVAMLIRLVIRAPFLCIGGLVMAFVIDVKLSIIMLIVLPIFIAILVFTMKKTVPKYKVVQKKLDNIALVLRENLGGVRIVRAFAKTDYEKGRFEEQNKEYEENAISVGKISALLNPLTTLIMNFGIGAIIWFGGIRVNTGYATTGEIIAFIGYVTQILAALIVISQLVVIYTKAFASMHRIAQVLDTKSSINDGMAIEQTLVKEAEYLSFKNVCMTYQPGSSYDIQNINLKIQKGQTVGIIGGTGSGKSTLVNLIGRFYDVSEGRILLEGRDVRDYGLDELRSKIGYVPQKSVLFSGTIADNIRWGKQDATEEEVMEAASIAQASEFIEKLPDKYNTKIRRGGVNVSGGQRQRLAIARAIVRKPEILVLDDSFTALDFITDAALRKAIKKNTQGMTTFIVSQRISTIKDADIIVVMNEGEVVGIGKHEELFENCEVYQEICHSQLKSQEGAWE